VVRLGKFMAVRPRDPSFRHVRRIYIEQGVLTDDDTHPWEFTFPQHILEYRNETEWESLTPSARQMDKQEGWRRVAPHELLDVLELAGVIHCREN
jgi:hypothetical protein